MQFFYNGQNGESHELRESKDKLIVRTSGGFDPASLFDHILVKPFGHRIRLMDYYPEASVYVYALDCANGEERDRLKDILRSVAHPQIVFVGTVMERADSGVYQIYTGNLFVKFKDHVDGFEQNNVLAKHNLNIKKWLEFTNNGYWCEPVWDVHRSIFDLCMAVLREPTVEFCHPELVVSRKTILPDVVPGAATDLDDWAARMIGLRESWNITRGKGARICIIDDGIDLHHPAFGANSRIVLTKDMSCAEGSDASHKDDSEMHGTACASIACGDDNGVLGVAPEADLLVVRSKGLGSVLESEAIYWAVKHGADIISCSWGPPDGNLILPPEKYHHHPLPDHTRLALEYATTKGRNGKGCLIFFAAGNGNEPVEYDGYASNEYVMAVGAVNKEGILTQYSDYGESLFCCFPSSEISIEAEQLSLIYGLAVADRIGIKGYSLTDYNSGFGGTSASCPGMAGVAGLMISTNPNLSLQEYKQLMQAACYIPKTDLVSDLKKKPGYGIVNAYKLLELTKNFNTTNSLTPMNANNTTKRIAIHVAVDELDSDVYQGEYQNLQGCKNDLELFVDLTRGVYNQRIFKDKGATRKAILDVLEDVVQNTNAGDEVVFTYSGHGGSISVREDSNEEDGKDETLVLHDGMLIDDEIRDIHLRFKKGVKVFWYTDCCHSGTNTRAIATAATMRSLQTITRNASVQKLYRLMPLEILNKAYLQSRDLYRNKRASLRNKRSARSVGNNEYAATIIHFAACGDSQYAAEIGGYGDFTRKLIDTFLADRSLTYTSLFDKVEKLMPYDQTPYSNPFGPDTGPFGNSPFLGLRSGFDNIEAKPNHKPTADTVSETSAFSDLETCTNLLIQGDGSAVEFNVKQGGRGATYTVRAKSEIRADGFNGSKIWDKAYDAYNKLKSQGNKNVFIEPDMASAIFGDPKVETSRSGDGYLDTYPSPEPGNELWHLSDDHSQLTKALKHACPQETVLGRNTQELNEYPLIAHIDTGVLSGGPLSPMNLDLNASFRFDDPIDKDKWYLPDFTEQQGHGNATAAILAGGKLSLPGETSLDANSYFGGFPFARVVTLKISESVAILRGKSFAKALNYAVDVLKADVVTMSMAGAPSKVMIEAVNNAYEKGVIVVCAGGNCWSQGVKTALPSTLMYPAILNRVIAATGATLNKTPYLNEFNPVTNRDSGGRFMQSCYGPLSAMRTALAAYTPNLLWFSEEGAPFYLKSGGGTSSATPQIAASAALYCFKYRDVLSTADQPWKKIEVVRQALFRSADSSQNSEYGDTNSIGEKVYNEYFGNGMLKAFDALQLDAGDLLNEINQNPENFKEEKETLGRTGIDDLFKMWFRSAVQPEADNTLKEMVALEIEQLIFTDPELAVFSGEKRLTYELKLKLYESERTSATLKKLLGKDIGFNNRANLSRSGRIMLQTEKVDIDEATSIYVSLQNIRGTITKTNDEVNDFHLGGFAVEVDNDTVRGGADPGIEVSYASADGDTVYLVTKEYEDGTKSYSWAETKDGASRGGEQLDVYMDEENVLYIDIAISRGIFKKIKKFFVNVFRTIRDQAASDMQGLLYAEKVNGVLQWSEIKNADKDIKEQIQSQAKTLFLSHGAFSSVEVSFRQLGADPEFLQELKNKNYGKYVLGFNMSSIKSGIEENAGDILASLKKLGIDNKRLTIVASSRGCLVARQAFRDGQRMILSAGPHLGTPMAAEQNISQLINRFTGLVITVSGVSSPVVGVLAFAAKLAIKFFWKMQGLVDMAPGSDFVNQLNTRYPLGNNDFLIGMNYTGKGLRSILDVANDNLIFAGKANDMVVPFDSAINNYDNPANTFYCTTHEEVHHLIYFGDKEIIETVNKWLV